VSLRLVDLPLPVVLALRDGEVSAAERLIGLPVPAEFAALTDIWSYMVTLLDGHPENAGWTMNALVRDGQIVGNAGFKGAPDDRGEIELGYRVLVAHRRQGLAVAAARLLLERAEREPTITRVLATINPDNMASIGVVTKAGFQPDGDRIHPRWGRQLRFLKSAEAVAD
jgi:ribosomal-protein-alanine N-acetyltransferase